MNKGMRSWRWAYPTFAYQLILCTFVVIANEERIYNQKKKKKKKQKKKELANNTKGQLRAGHLYL